MKRIENGEYSLGYISIQNEVWEKPCRSASGVLVCSYESDYTL
jgi:hypothetical protein